jgi:hypothetical protein
MGLLLILIKFVFFVINVSLMVLMCRIQWTSRFYTWGTRLVGKSFEGASGGGLARVSLGEQNSWIPRKGRPTGTKP